LTYPMGGEIQSRHNRIYSLGLWRRRQNFQHWIF
jgi:hypothetical protein